MRKLLVLAMLCPLAVLAQGPGNGNGPGPNGRGGRGMGMGMGPGAGTPEQVEKRMKLARVLGLAEALDLETGEALELGKTLEKFDARRDAARKQLHDAREVLQKAARGETKPPLGEVDGAVTRIFEARLQLLAVDRDMIAAVSKSLPNLPPEKRARAALFLGRFEDRMEKRVHPRRGGRGDRGPGGPGGLGGDLGPMGPERQSRAFVFRGRMGEDQLEVCVDEECPELPEE